MVFSWKVTLTRCFDTGPPGDILSFSQHYFDADEAKMIYRGLQTFYIHNKNITITIEKEEY